MEPCRWAVNLCKPRQGGLRRGRKPHKSLSLNWGAVTAGNAANRSQPFPRERAGDRLLRGVFRRFLQETVGVLGNAGHANLKV